MERSQGPRDRRQGVRERHGPRDARRERLPGGVADEHRGLLRKVEVHPGLVCIETERGDGFDIAKQLRLFEEALHEVKGVDLMNKAVDVVEEADGGTRIDWYEIP